MGNGNMGAVGVVIAAGVFAFSSSASIFYALAYDTSLSVDLIGQWSVVLVSLGFGVVAYNAFTNVESTSGRNVIGVSSGVGFVLAGLISSGFSYYQYVSPVANATIDAALFQVLFVALVGGFAGLVVGVEKTRRRRARSELSRTVGRLDSARRVPETDHGRHEDSNQRLEQFAYAASHDLQEPLRMVTNYLELIERRYGDVLDEEGEEFLEFAVDGADRMRTMIDGLLEYSRVETRGEPLESVELDAVVEFVLTDLHLQVDDCDATVEVGELPRVRGDPNQLRQLFQNLLSNALKYSHESPPEVRVTGERDGDEAVIAVADDGIGIAPEEQDRIFEMFQRLHSREEYDGSGVGLALCQRIVERHDGDIDVDSEPGEGASFYVTLPAADD